MTKPRVAGLRGSRPVSRILSRMTIRLCGLPGSSAGRLGGACSPCTGRGLASRRVATTLVGSYPTVSPLPSTSREIRRRRSPFCATFRRLSPPGSPQRPALRCPDFPRATRARGHPACTRIVAATPQGGSCETGSPQRRRSHEAASCACRLPRRRCGGGGQSWECAWTTLLPRGQLTVEGPFYDTRDSVLAITGGTGAYENARGSMELKSRAGGTELAFIFPLIG